MEAHRIWVRAHEAFDEDPGFPQSYGNVPTYIRADLVEKLLGYVAHHDKCGVYSVTNRPRDCTCGLTELLEEMK